ncbi:copper amine oxidase-like protein [Anoxybacillus vitaminiphilus]|uniref:Copper amine oxidase-like protein n=1 Tax=Paranoxybacillus vitaminiphilus TaxID=581036 RepID=A0A327YF07_9BACL|nr:copper amine oxidase N-terminal domain-containing protein [Anoxybacillus vitaminiphilus]RAK19473.1 copper amine oxidase-like protein [Anoxybacillus vitaminiphilus]
MRKIFSILSFIFFISATAGFHAAFVQADDDEKKYEERGEYEHENDDEYDHDDDERYEEEYDEEYDEEFEEERNANGSYYEQNTGTSEKRITLKQEYWYKWSRSPEAPDKFAATPISSEKTVPIQFKEKDLLYTNVIPMKGQLFVPLEETAQHLGASVIVYSTSKIAEIKLNDKLLIVKNGSRAAYENMKKTPMPLPIFEKNQKLYIPISVLANSLGFQVTWTKQQQILVY